MKFAVAVRIFYSVHGKLTMNDIWVRIIEAYRVARSSKDKPWVLQDKLKKLLPELVSVGDDLSFTVKLERDVFVDEEKILLLGAKKTSIYPFKRAYRFEKGYVAVEGRFIRISRELEEETLRKILDALS